MTVTQAQLVNWKARANLELFDKWLASHDADPFADMVIELVDHIKAMEPDAAIGAALRAIPLVRDSMLWTLEAPPSPEAIINLVRRAVQS